MKILIIHTFGVGDMIMFTPALEQLVKMFPFGKIDFLITDSASQGVIEHNPAINRIYLIKYNTRSLIKFAFRLRKERYDVSIITSGVRPWKGMVYSALIGASVKCGEYDKFRFLYKYNTRRSSNQHRVVSNLKIINSIGATTPSEIKCHYYLSQEDIDFANRYLEEKNIASDGIIFGIHPGCNIQHKEKRWPTEYYIALIRSLAKKYRNIYFSIFLGPDEFELGKILKEELNINNVLFIDSLTISQVAALISKCKYFLNNDSGLGHIAGCFDMKQLWTIWGPANEKVAKIFHPKLTIIKVQGLSETQKMELDSNGILKCLSNINPAEVFKIIDID